MMTGRSPKVVVIGGTYVDMAVRCSQIPSPGQSFAGSALSYTTTGPGPNQAVEAALCGCEFVYTAEAMNTGVVVTLVNGTGENATCHYPGANCALQPKDIADAEQVIAEANVCLIHGQLPQETIVSALRAAELHGVKVILNPARPLEKSGEEGGDLPIEYFTADIVIPNLFEAAEITDQSTANIRTAKMIGSDLVSRGVAYAVITMGRRGCMVVDRNSADQIPAFEVDLVDHAGSGDAFAGALAAYCAVEDDVRAAVKFASAAGALACTKFGTIEALPTKAEIIELLQVEDIE
jgi:ribokinase